VLRLGNGKAAFDPIRTTLNDGKVAIDADLILDDPNGLGLRIARGSRIDGATINEVVSHDILSYIAPVLSQSTQVRGKLSLVVNDAVVPILGNTLTQADALTRFENVIFQPGAFVSEVLGMGGIAAPQLKLDQTLKILIADGRVNQSGLSIDVPGGSKVQLDGSVGLDQTLALRAQMPITGQMLGKDKTLNEIVGDTKVTIPIGGTLSRPALDKKAFQVALRDAAKSMVRKGVRNELNGVLDQVLPGVVPGAKPGKPGARGSIGNDALKVLEGVGRDLIDPKKKKP
jgi:translocation and assembly module TamB